MTPRQRLAGLAFVLALAAVTGAVATRASAPGAREAERPATPAEPAAAPGRISVEPATFDFGHVTKGKEVERPFVVRNYGAGPLEIVGVSTSCGCTVVEGGDKVVKPAGSTVLRVRLATRNMSGAISKSVMIRSNDPENPSVELTLKATVDDPEKIAER